MDINDNVFENENCAEESCVLENDEEKITPDTEAEENAEVESAPKEEDKQEEPEAKKPWKLIVICCAVFVAVVTLLLVLMLGGKDKTNTPDNEENSEGDGQTAVCSHTSVEWITDREADCTSEGARHKECTLCRETLSTETIAAKGHTITTYPAKAPDCESIGWNEYSVCSVCDYTDYSPINPVHKVTDGFCTGCSSRVIMTKEDLLAVNSKENMNRYFVLGADIDLGGMEWTPIGSDAGVFSGRFNGSVYKISNFKITAAQNVNNTWCVGFIAYNNGVVKNLTLDNFVIDVSDYSQNLINVGSVVGSNKGTVDNCHVSSGTLKVNAKTLYLGGIAGDNRSVISNSVADIVIDASVSGNHITAGGICGFTLGGSITDCAFVGEHISGSANSDDQSIIATIGGIVGKSQGNATVTRCYSTGDVNAFSQGTNGATKSYCGGVVGSNWSSEVSQSYSIGNVSAKSDGESFAAGIAADNRGSVTTSYAAGNISAEGASSRCKATNVVNDVDAGTHEDCYYVKGQSFSVKIGDELSNAPTAVSGTEIELYDLLSTSFLGETLGFDLDRWVVSGSDHPTLKPIAE